MNDEKIKEIMDEIGESNNKIDYWNQQIGDVQEMIDKHREDKRQQANIINVEIMICQRVIDEYRDLKRDHIKKKAQLIKDLAEQ